MEATKVHHDMLDAAILGLFRKPPRGSKASPSVFLTTLFSSLQIIWNDEPEFWGNSVPTAATDGLRLWISPSYFESLNPQTRVSILAHEIWHVAYMHMDRLEERCPDKWNEAADYAINFLLKEYGFELGHRWLYDAQYAGMSAEQIYELIKADGPNDNILNGDVRGSGPGNTPLSQEELHEALGNVIRAGTLSKMSGDPPGSLPGDLETKIDNLLNPKLPWYILLRRFFQEIGTAMYTWKRPARRYIGSGIYLPGVLPDDDGLSHIVYACDSSGSVDDDQLKAMNSEISGIQKQFNPEKMTLMVFDTVVNSTEVFTRDEAIPPMTFVGRGGTALVDLWEKVAELRPSALVVFSDLECAFPAELKGIPVLWVCLDNPKKTVPYGRLIHLDS